MRKFIFFVLVFISPFWILGISSRLVFNNWFIDFEYSRKDFPKDRFGLDNEYRRKLAKLGLKAVLSKEGLEEFKKAKLPDGRKAFRQKEINHMEDVNKFLSILFPLSYFLFILWLLGLIFLKDLRKSMLLYSGIFSILFLISIGLLSFTDYNKAFEIFHNFFFGKTSWRFSNTDTLLRIYPMKFWFDGTVAIGVIFIIISSLILLSGNFIKKND